MDMQSIIAEIRDRQSQLDASKARLEDARNSFHVSEKELLDKYGTSDPEAIDEIFAIKLSSLDERMSVLKELIDRVEISE